MKRQIRSTHPQWRHVHCLAKYNRPPAAPAQSISFSFHQLAPRWHFYSICLQTKLAVNKNVVRINLLVWRFLYTVRKLASTAEYCGQTCFYLASLTPSSAPLASHMPLSTNVIMPSILSDADIFCLSVSVYLMCISVCLSAKKELKLTDQKLIYNLL